MRRWPIAAAVAGLALALAGVALAAFTQYSNITLTAQRAGQSTGIKANVYSSSPGHAPKSAKKLIVAFPANTKFNLGSIEPCTLSSSQIKSGKSCPASSKVDDGKGTVAAVAVSNGQSVLAVKGTVAAYAAGATKMIMVAKAGGQTVVIPETTSGNNLTITIPKTTATVGGKTYDVVLTGLQVTVPKHGSGSDVLIKAGKCTSNKFVITTHFVYTDGSQKTIKSNSFCF